MYPTREKVFELLKIGEQGNPGPWIKHSTLVAECAEKIAKKCGMDSEKAFVLGLLHDIGRSYGVSYFKHVSDGYYMLMELDFDEAAQICLTHSFSDHNIESYCGKFDVSKDELEKLNEILTDIQYDNYDKLIQLCDALAGTEIVDMNERMDDVERRYGNYPKAKREATLSLRGYFENLCGEDIYKIVK